MFYTVKLITFFYAENDCCHKMLGLIIKLHNAQHCSGTWSVRRNDAQ